MTYNTYTTTKPEQCQVPYPALQVQEEEFVSTTMLFPYLRLPHRSLAQHIHSCVTNLELGHSFFNENTAQQTKIILHTKKMAEAVAGRRRQAASHKLKVVAEQVIALKFCAHNYTTMDLGLLHDDDELSFSDIEDSEDQLNEAGITTEEPEAVIEDLTISDEPVSLLNRLEESKANALSNDNDIQPPIPNVSTLGRADRSLLPVDEGEARRTDRFCRVWEIK